MRWATHGRAEQRSVSHLKANFDHSEPAAPRSSNVYNTNLIYLGTRLLLLPVSSRVLTGAPYGKGTARHLEFLVSVGHQRSGFSPA